MRWGLGGIRGIKELGIGFAAGEAAFFGGELEGFFAVEFGLTDEFVDAVGEGLGGIARGGLAGEGRADQEGDFAANGFVFEGCRKLGKRGATEFFVDFGDFSGEASGAVAENLECFGDGVADAVRSFVEDERAVLDAEAFESAAAFARARREKSDK